MGLGGGFLLTHFDAKSGLVEALDAREAAPGASHEEMFQWVQFLYLLFWDGIDPFISLRKRESFNHILRGEAESARYGAKSVAVPGEAAGYWEAKQKYGLCSTNIADREKYLIEMMTTMASGRKTF